MVSGQLLARPLCGFNSCQKARRRGRNYEFIIIQRTNPIPQERHWFLKDLVTFERLQYPGQVSTAMVNTMIKTIWGEKSLFRVGTWRQEKAVGEALGPMARSVQLVFLDNPGPPYPLPISARWHHPLICWALPYQSLIKKLPPRLPTSQSDGCIFSIFVPSSK